MDAVGDTGFDFVDLVDDVVQRAGGETASAEDIQKIRRGLRIILERWAQLRYNTWRLGTTTVGAGGVPSIRLPKNIDDVITVQSQNPNEVFGQITSSASMRRIGFNEYAQLTTKDTKGRPSQWYLDRDADCPTLYIYPIGRANTIETLEVYYVERPAKFDLYGSDVDAPGRWLEALVTALAWDLARKRPVDGGGYNEPLIARLKSEADEATLIAQNSDRSRHRYRFRLGGKRK